MWKISEIPMIDVAKKGAVHKVMPIQTVCETMNETLSYMKIF